MSVPAWIQTGVQYARLAGDVEAEDLIYALGSRLASGEKALKPGRRAGTGAVKTRTPRRINVNEKGQVG